MINERDIAARFTSVWSQVFPLLTPNFMNKFNQSKLTTVPKNTRVVSKGHPDVVSEMAFNFSKMSHEKKLALNKIKGNPTLVVEAFRTSVKSIQNSARSIYLPDELSQEEIDESILLAENIMSFSLMWSSNRVIYGPKLPGYGIIGECTADLSIDDTIFEIKTVTRTFRSKDLKQLLLYVALQSVSSPNKWTHAGLYNPRNCQYCKFEIESIVRNLSAYETSQEACRDLLEFFVRDVQIDKSF